MYSNDLNNAYLYETERRMDEMAEATNYRLCKECNGNSKKKSGFSMYIPSLLLALLAFFVKR